MAEIVGAFATGHAPAAPGDVALRGASSPFAALFGAVNEHVNAVDPDVLVVFDTDHFSTFFYDNMPTFAVGVAPRTYGPGFDEWPGIPAYDEIVVDEELARHVHRGGIESGFDLASTAEFGIDHSLLVPLHFLNPAMRRPIVPVWINGIAPPMPLARRCFDLGATIGRLIDSWSPGLRVGIVASGSISGDIGGPRAWDHSPAAGADPVWTSEVLGYLRDGRVDDLLNAATADRIIGAGNVSGELLNWIALLGIVGTRRPEFLESQFDDGFAYAAWRFDR